jgi:hypothetical protein
MILFLNLGIVKSFGQGGIRTPDTVVRSHILYPAEIHALFDR